jgi:3-oxoacyl-[acyl-carrier protein] reductase
MNDQRVVVTGASGRLGRVLVRMFEDHGAIVTAVDRAPSEVGARRFVEGDLSDETSAKSVFDTIARSGAPDVVVHAVGMWGETPVDTTSLSDWRTVFDINLTSTFLCFREALRCMTSGGRLIAFAAGQGADRAAPRQAAYSAAKAGVVRLVEATDAEVRDRGIRAFAIAPSMILFGEDDGPGTRDIDLARLCLYLASDAGRSLAGSVIRSYG